MIVLDSSFLVGFNNERDAHHKTARANEWIVFWVESGGRDLAVARRVGRLLLDAEELDFVSCGDLFMDAWDCPRTRERQL